MTVCVLCYFPVVPRNGLHSMTVSFPQCSYSLAFCTKDQPVFCSLNKKTVAFKSDNIRDSEDRWSIVELTEILTVLSNHQLAR